MDDGHDSDRIEGLPHPREALRFFGHALAEREMLDAYRSGRLPQTWLIGGPRGIGKATLAWRFARFLMAYPDPDMPAVRNAQTLDVPAEHPVWAKMRSGAMGDIAVLRRQWNEKTKKFYGDIRVDGRMGAVVLVQRLVFEEEHGDDVVGADGATSGREHRHVVRVRVDHGVHVGSCLVEARVDSDCGLIGIGCNLIYI